MQIDPLALAQRIKQFTAYGNDEHIVAAVMLFETFNNMSDEEFHADAVETIRDNIYDLQEKTKDRFLWLLQQIFYYHPCAIEVQDVACKCLSMGLYETMDFQLLATYRAHIEKRRQVFYA